MNTILGYTGACKDPVTGSLPLGNGYRTYVAGPMRFYAPDDLSPFGRGGVNPYAYCEGDPINRSDPSGHITLESLANIQKFMEPLAAKEAARATTSAASGIERVENRLVQAERHDTLDASVRANVHVNENDEKNIAAPEATPAASSAEKPHFDTFFPSNVKFDNSYDIAVRIDLLGRQTIPRLFEYEDRMVPEHEAAVALARHHGTYHPSWQLGGVRRGVKRRAEEALEYADDVALQLRSTYRRLHREAPVHIAPDVLRRARDLDEVERYRNKGRLLPWDPPIPDD